MLGQTQTIIVAQADTGAETAAQGTTTGTEVPAAVHKTFPPFDGSTFPSQLLWLVITFGALYLLMSKLALPRVGEILEVRRDRVEGDLAEAERLRQQTDEAISSYETELAQARQKAHDIAEKTRSEIKADIDDKRSKVEADLAKKVAAAEARIQQTKAEALSHVGEIAADTAAVMVSRIGGKVTAKAARDAVAAVEKE
jgi:F-type H+-transporting ATPase subunit b